MYEQQPAQYRSYPNMSVEKILRTVRLGCRFVAAQHRDKRLVQQQIPHTMPTRDPPDTGVGRCMSKGTSPDGER